MDARTAAFLHPRPAPRHQVGGCPGVEDCNQIRPCRVGHRVGLQVLAQPITKRILADQLLELAHDDGRLLVDDGAVERSRFTQVGEWLPDGIGTGRAVHVVGCRVVRIEEPQRVIHLGEGRVHDLRGHKIREDLLHPHVVEPAHGDQIAEPHMRRLVRDQAGAPQSLILRGAFVEQQRRLVVEHGAGMFHAAELERGDQHEVEFAEGVGAGRVVLKPCKRRRVQVKHRVHIARDLGRIVLAVKHAERPPVPFGRFDAELARRKRDKVGRDGFGAGEGDRGAPPAFGPCRFCAVGHRHPVAGHLKRHQPAPFEVRLIKHRHRQRRPCGHKQGVEQFVLAVEGVIARNEREGHFVGGVGLKQRRRNHQVAVA